MNWIKRLFCKHQFVFVRNIYGDEINKCGGHRTLWKCSKCGYEWNIKISSRYIKGNGCQKCAGNKRWETRKENQK